MNTPLTDAIEYTSHPRHIPNGIRLVTSDFARQLERDRARLLEVVKALKNSQHPHLILSAKQQNAYDKANTALASLEIKDDK